MPRSLWRTLLALACMVAALAFAACGGDDEDEGTGSGGTAAQSEEGGDNHRRQHDANPARHIHDRSSVMSLNVPLRLFRYSRLGIARYMWGGQ